MRFFNKVLTGTLALAVAFNVAAPLVAQEEPEAAAPAPAEFQFDDAVEVNVINVDVYVTDKSGNPITGLTKDDFEIYESKRPVTVTNFYAVADGEPVAGGIEPTELSIRDNDPLASIPEDQRLSLVVYVDNFNIRPFNRNRVFRRLREFLREELQPGDRAMLVSYDRSIHVRHPFTTDPSLIAHATFDLEKLTGHAVHRDSDRRDLIRDIEEAENIAEVQWRVKQFAESEFNDLSFSLSALQEFVDTLAGLPGRKALLYVSDGLEMTTGEDLYYAMHYRFRESILMSEARDFNANRKFRSLAQAANSNRVRFITIDAAGLRVYSSATAEKATANFQPGMGSHSESILFQNLQGSLDFMAEETGGYSIKNTNDVGDGLRRVARSFQNYYSLGYSPAHAGDGRYYEIEVKLKDPKRFGKKVRISHREGYRDKNTHTRMADGTASTLLYGLGKNPLDVKITLGSGRRDNKFYMVPISVTVPLEQVVLVQQDDFYFGRLKLFFSAMDEKGDMADVQEVPLQLRIPADQLELVLKQPYRLVQTQLQMKGGGHRVAVGVRDEIGAAESFVTREVFVGS